MPRKRRVETEVEKTHGHCADLLMSDYRIPKDRRVQVCEQVAMIWRQNTMIHCLIIASVRGYQPHPATRGLSHFLDQHATQQPKNHKKDTLSAGRSQGHFDSQGFYREH